MWNKKKQDVLKTKQDLNQKVNPTNFEIVNVEQRQNGSVIIQSESNEERENIKEALESEMGETYNIKIPNQTDMKID